MMHTTKMNLAPCPIITHHHRYVFVGSCFAQTIMKKLKSAQFDVDVHPFGVLFHPISIAKALQSNKDNIKSSVFMREDVALSWLANGTCFAYEKKVLEDKMIAENQIFLTTLKQSKILFVTFGTAWGYQLNTTGEIVSNCHKIPSYHFTKSLTTVESIIEAWESVLEELSSNQNLKIIFTLSPIRHSKDGLIENAKSKAILLIAIHHLVAKFEKAYYFPSYEIVIDELRDYSFFEADGVHLNKEAIDFIWQYFKLTYFTEETIKIDKEYQQLQQMMMHKMLYPKSKSAFLFKDKCNQKWNDFIKRYPWMDNK